MTQMDNTLKTLCTQKYGRVDALKSSIGEPMFRRLEAMGYIINAPSVDGNTWRVSNSAMRHYKLTHRKSTFLENLKDKYLRIFCSIDLSY